MTAPLKAEELANVLGVTLPHREATGAPSPGGRNGSMRSGPVGLEPVDLESIELERVVTALEKITAGDRSKDVYRVVAACVDAELTEDETHWVVRSRTTPAGHHDLAQKLDESPEDFLRCWRKVHRERTLRRRELVGERSRERTPQEREPGCNTETVVTDTSALQPDPLAGLRTGAWLNDQTFNPLAWIIRGLIPEGLTLLVGPPKVGKSWLILDLSCALASGDKALGKIDVGLARPVLLLALEDGDRRLQSRCRELLGLEPIPKLLHYLTQIPEGCSVLEVVRAWLETIDPVANPLVILDTLGKVMPPARRGETDYQRDYRVAGELKALADERPGTSVVVVHHDRKAAAEDFVHSVSGTNGLAGGADSIILLKRQRTKGEATLLVTGREVEEAEYAATMTGGKWTLDGDDLEQAAKHAQERREVSGLGDTSAEVLAEVRKHPKGVTPAQVAAALNLPDARIYLARLHDKGRIGKSGRGVYVPVTSVSTVTSATDGTVRCLVCSFPLPTALVDAGEISHAACEEIS